MIDEEFYLGKQSETGAVPVAKPEKAENTEPQKNPDEPKDAEPQPNGDAPEKEVPPDGEDYVKLDKKTKLIYLVIFLGILCAAMIGGIFIAGNRIQKKTPEKARSSLIFICWNSASW